MFKDSINKQLWEEKRMIDGDLEKERDRVKKKNLYIMLILGGITTILIVFSSLILLEYQTLEHEYILTSCDLSCARQYWNITYYAEGYFHNDDGSYTCLCSNESVLNVLAPGTPSIII